MLFQSVSLVPSWQWIAHKKGLQGCKYLRNNYTRFTPTDRTAFYKYLDPIWRPLLFSSTFLKLLKLSSWNFLQVILVSLLSEVLPWQQNYTKYSEKIGSKDNWKSVRYCAEILVWRLILGHWVRKVRHQCIIWLLALRLFTDENTNMTSLWRHT